ncbi:serine hydrolase domain-containing protein [Arachidicoccus terrestris]|uniref:serine hydrolase domain-containing protein n=1 Tax=Arachidicoccus terrestris TaxID=2875539 RepID=UPI001CC52CC4|nr:serine hydrolase domain-containing protein [Arachidicoccus terrestris]UAY55783.1 beta-lactamase family protein [Arachidicoccus terrestris]
MYCRRIYVAMMFVFFAASFTFGQSKADLINEYLSEGHKAGLFNGNVLVAEKGKIVTEAAVGYADALQKDTLTMAYRFHNGSISKEFDAVGIMMLAEQGKLQLSDKVSRFFPDLPAWAKKISIWNLLQYTSGLPEVQYGSVHGDADNWKDLKKVKALDFEPGTRYAYNNNNTFLRRMIIAKVAGKSFNDFVQQDILKQAGIKNGIVDPTQTDALIARSFDNNFKQDGLEVPISGWTCLDATDFYKWAECINHFRLISPASTKTILTPFKEGNQCGLGSGVIDGDTVKKHVHDGVAVHYQALEYVDNKNGIDRVIIILSNQRQGNVYKIAEAICNILDGMPFQKLE